MPSVALHHTTDLEYFTCNEQGELKPLTNPAWFK